MVTVPGTRQVKTIVLSRTIAAHYKSRRTLELTRRPDESDSTIETKERL
jgi:hypothetical protein